ncbi:hypothetical protein PVAG01_10191 [Phlyctema vagabunda]|uniref:Uncharacterized protein n=1 Tax=Phlyctema vagabunda TaxID=108571 RepID=A0ABR4P579_9HELO
MVVMHDNVTAVSRIGRGSGAYGTEVPDLISNDSPIPRVNFRGLSARFTTKELLQISAEGKQLLLTLSRDVSSAIDPSPLLEAGRVKRFKVEEPILRTDHQLDCRNFARRDTFEPQLFDIRLPQECIDDEKGEGLCIPTQFWHLGQEKLDKIKAEKPQLPKDSFKYLATALSNTYTEADGDTVWKSLQCYKRSGILELVTPPLLPSDPSPVPHVPTSSDLNVPLLSDPPSLVGMELQSIEETLFEQDLGFHVETGHSPDPIDLFGFSDHVKASKSIKFKDIKLEETLTPPQAASPKNVHFSPLIEAIPPFSPPSSAAGPKEDNYFKDAFGDADERIMRIVEQEKLPPEESFKARVVEPIIDLTLPAPPWKQIEKYRQSTKVETMQKDMIRLAIGDSMPVLKGMRALNHKLSWSPFSKWKPQISLDGPISVDDRRWEKYVYGQDDEKIFDSSEFTWKPPGLKILRDDDEDSEIDFGFFENPETIHTPAVNQTMDAADQSINLTNTIIGHAEALVKPAVTLATAARDFMKNNPSKPRSSEGAKKSKLSFNAPTSLIGGDFSAENEMDNFLALRGSKRQKLSDSSYFASAKASTQTQPATIAPQSSTQVAEGVRIGTPAINLPSPILNPPAYPVSIIVASTLLKQRSLIRQIESLFPSLSLTERDFSRHNTAIWEPGRVSRSPIISPLASEADLAISASTGIILTTLAKVRQKPLPGQKGRSALRERVEVVNMRYEKLTVLVSEGADRAQELADADTMALSEFIAFASALPGSARVHYVAGGEVEIGKWLTYHIIQHAPASERGAKEITLLEDETHWELFLRRAGLNAFAAQLILGQLKGPEGEAPNPELSGLLAFVKMGNQARIEMFAGLCGGAKVLSRVGRLIDARWD